MAARKEPERVSGADTGAAASKPAGVPHGELRAHHAATLMQLDHENDVEMSKAEAVVSRLKDTQRHGREAFLAAHAAELEARQAEVVKRWVPRMTAAVQRWRLAPSRETTSAVGAEVRGYIEESDFACGRHEPLLFGVAFSEAMIAEEPESITKWSNTNTWRNQIKGEALSELTVKAFAALTQARDIGGALRALELLESHFVALQAAPWLSGGSGVERLAEAKADWEIFRSGESLIAIEERFNSPERRRQNTARQAAATDARNELIRRAQSGDPEARSFFGEAWSAIERHLKTGGFRTQRDF